MLLVAVLATARVCCAQLASIQSIDRELQRKAEAGQFSGSVLIAKGGRILLPAAARHIWDRGTAC